MKLWWKKTLEDQCNEKKKKKKKKKPLERFRLQLWQISTVDQNHNASPTASAMNYLKHQPAFVWKREATETGSGGTLKFCTECFLSFFFFCKITVKPQKIEKKLDETRNFQTVPGQSGGRRVDKWHRRNRWRRPGCWGKTAKQRKITLSD